MRVRITSPGEFDRHDAEVRFVAVVDGRAVGVSITAYALFILGEALEMPRAEPLVTYAASGRLLEAVVGDVVGTAGRGQSTYLVSHDDVLRVTGSSGQGNPHVPKRWQS
jgi:hypothetical protein